jgi:TatD DNase family protein
MLIDTHCHINDERLLKDIDFIINQINDNLDCAINVGYDLISSQISVDLADKYLKIYSAVGIHPEYVNDVTIETLSELTALCKKDKVVAIGEIGLDYHYSTEYKEKQKEIFIKQLEMADSLKLPVIIHSRDATEDTYNILSEYKNKIKNGIVMHCYSGSAEMVKEYDKLDCYYSFGGIITYSNSKSKVINAIKDERLLLETDCPYNTPNPFKGNLNYPHYIRYTAMKMAEFKGKSFEEIEKLTTENAFRLFSKIKIR